MTDRLALVGGSVVVGTAGGDLRGGSGAGVLEGASVVIEDGRIVSVGGGAPPHDAEVLDVTGHTILPGLIDAHVHLASFHGLPEARRPEMLAASMRSLLEAGITTVRDLGAQGRYLFDLREAAARGACAAPRLVLCGQVISAVCPGATAFPDMYRETTGTEEIRAAVAEQAAAGADVIKVMSTGALTVADEDVNPAQLEADELGALVAAAHRLGLPVASHAEGAEGIRLSVEAGADTIEHGEMGHEVESALAAMAERGIVLVPTLSVFDYVAESDSFPPWMRERGRRLGESARLTVAAARRNGVAIAMGADAPPQGGNAGELLRLADAGLSTGEVVAAATGIAARACGLDELVGTVEVGKIADLLVVDGDPLLDLRVLTDSRRLSLVLQAGVPVARSGRLVAT